MDEDSWGPDKFSSISVRSEKCSRSHSMLSDRMGASAKVVICVIISLWAQIVKNSLGETKTGINPVEAMENIYDVWRTRKYCSQSIFSYLMTINDLCIYVDIRIRLALDRLYI